MLMSQLSKGVKGMSYHTQLASNNFLVFSEKNIPDSIFNLYVFFGHLHSTIKIKFSFIVNLSFRNLKAHIADLYTNR